MSSVVTRFAPSPTGFLHAGNYRTAVFAYLFAKHHGGSFILRIEDTDRARSKPEYEANILDALAWLDLPFERQYRQSDNAPRHRELLEQLIADNLAYVSKETPKNQGDREEVIRFRNPGEAVSFVDMIRGEITMDTRDLGDFVIARSLDEPIFHFAVVVDDADEGVTHVVRGEDHISNTPRQILIQRALGFATPAYAHLPLILGTDRTKLSKRKGAKAITEYRALGLLPEATLNYLSLLGWNPGDDREYLSRSELIESFDLARVQKGSAIFDETKFFSINQHWMRKLSDERFLACLDFVNPESREGFTKSYNPTKLTAAIPLLKERAQTFGEARDMLAGELSCLFTKPTLDAGLLTAKEPTDRPGMTQEALKALLGPLEALPASASVELVKDTIMPFADAEEAKGKGGRGAVLWPLRYALSGRERSPDPFTLVSILDKDETIRRLRLALAILEK